ncbi:formin-binding protein 1 homolog isoform X3 [Penaeus indicus]|uniref:formin-binding protein 1 homolog isoform X3 n=1 Tax=Penaeus indicus TaxID=29960 RepID=UPI00300C9B73
MVYRCEEVLLSYNKFNETKDQWDCIAGHTQKGITFLETYSHFIKERCQIELDYARGLRRLVKAYLPKKKEGEDLQFTSVKAFRDAVSETADLAGQHEVISETLTANVYNEISTLIKELKEERKKHLAEGSRVQQNLSHSLQQLEKAKKNYEKAFREAEKAHENFTKADADLHLSRAEVEKQRMNASIKSQQCEDSKNEYANQLQKTNRLQSDHYNSIMPGIFQSLQDMDEKRINNFKNLLKKSVETERSVFPIINKCLDGIISAADSIDEKNDSMVVIERYKSGFTPPGDIPFDDLSTPRQNGEMTPNHPPLRHDTIKGTISASKLKKRGGLFGIFGSNKEDFSDLPPNQRKKRIQQRIDDVTFKLHQETAARDGLLKMKEVYEGNPSLGDPMSIMGQLNDSCQRIEKLRADLKRYQDLLEDADGDPQGVGGGAASGGPSTPNASLARHHSTVMAPHHNGGGASPRSSVTSHRTSLSDESLSRSASDSSVCCTNPPSSSNTTSTTTTTTSSSLQRVTISTLATTTTTTAGETSNPTPSDPLPSQGSSHSPESGIGLSHNSLPGSDTYDQPDGADDDNAEFYDAEPLPIIGTCRALYTFDGTSEGSMSMTEGEELNVIELDQGDGWTRVRRMRVFEEGFVPTTYIEMALYNNC